jgi:hypothetical protein
VKYTNFTETFEIVPLVGIKTLMNTHDVIQWNALPFGSSFVELFVALAEQPSHQGLFADNDGFLKIAEVT